MSIISSIMWNTRSIIVTLVYCTVCLSGAHGKSQGKQPLDLTGLPRFLKTNNNYSYNTGQVAVLKCAVANLGSKQQVIWRRASDPPPLTVGYLSFSEDPRLSVEHRGNNWNLVIRDVQLKDAGVYECQISSKMRHLRHHVTLMVTEPVIPDIPVMPTGKPNIQISGSNYVDEGERLYLVCNATSKDYPPEDIDWFRAGNALETDRSVGMSIQKHVAITVGTIYSTLEIKHAQISDAGVYVCRTSNKDVISTQVNVLNSSRETNKKRGTVKGDGIADRSTSDNSGQSWSSCPVLLVVSAVAGVLVTWNSFRSVDLT